MSQEPSTLSDKSYKGEHFKKCPQIFVNCTFDACQFDSARQVQFCDCTFINSNLNLVNIEGARFQGVTFKECKLVGLGFHTCERKFFSIRCEKSILLSCNFSEMKMKQAYFQACKLKECHFNQTQLMKANFSQADLSETFFHHCDLTQADFRGAINYSINPLTNTLKKAHFSPMEALSMLSFFDIQVENS